MLLFAFKKKTKYNSAVLLLIIINQYRGAMMNKKILTKWKRLLILTSYIVSLISFLMAILCWNLIGYRYVILFVIFFCIFLLSTLFLASFCFANLLLFINREFPSTKENKQFKKKLNGVLDRYFSFVKKGYNYVRRHVKHIFKKPVVIDYTKFGFKELKTMAKEKNIQGYYKMNKESLITALKQVKK